MKGHAEANAGRGFDRCRWVILLPYALNEIQGMYYNLMAEIGSEHDSSKTLSYARRYLEIFSGLASRYPDRADFVLEQSNGFFMCRAIRMELWRIIFSAFRFGRAW